MFIVLATNETRRSARIEFIEIRSKVFHRTKVIAYEIAGLRIHEQNDVRMNVNL